MTHSPDPEWQDVFGNKGCCIDLLKIHQASAFEECTVFAENVKECDGFVECKVQIVLCAQKTKLFTETNFLI